MPTNHACFIDRLTNLFFLSKQIVVNEVISSFKGGKWSCCMQDVNCFFPFRKHTKNWDDSMSAFVQLLLSEDLWLLGVLVWRLQLLVQVPEMSPVFTSAVRIGNYSPWCKARFHQNNLVSGCLYWSVTAIQIYWNLMTLLHVLVETLTTCVLIEVASNAFIDVHKDKIFRLFSW